MAKKTKSGRAPAKRGDAQPSPASAGQGTASESPVWRIWIFGSALLAFFIGAAVWAHLHPGFLNPRALQAWLNQWGAWAPLIFIVVYAVATVALIPGSIFDATGGILFGPVWGSIFNLFGALLGATLAFLVSRYVAGDVVARMGSDRVNRVVRGVEADGWRFVAFVRLVPIFPFNIFNYLLGLTRIPLVPYILASAIFMAPATVAYTWIGHAGREALSGDIRAIVFGVVALGILGAIALLPRLIERIRRKKS